MYILSFTFDRLNFYQVKGRSMWNFNDSSAVIEWKDNKTLNFKIDASDTPVRYSYHCGRLTFTEGSGNDQITLTLSHFQVRKGQWFLLIISSPLNFARTKQKHLKY